MTTQISSEKKTAKAKTRKKRSMFSKFVSLVVIGFSLFMLVGVGREVLTTMELRQQISVVEQELATLQEENKYLTLLMYKAMPEEIFCFPRKENRSFIFLLTIRNS